MDMHKASPYMTANFYMDMHKASPYMTWTCIKQVPT